MSEAHLPKYATLGNFNQDMQGHVGKILLYNIESLAEKTLE